MNKFMHWMFEQYYGEREVTVRIDGYILKKGNIHINVPKRIQPFVKVTVTDNTILNK